MPTPTFAWRYGNEFVNHADAQLVAYWNDGDGSLSWLRGVEAELTRRGYTCRTRDAADPRPRVRGERLHLTARERK